MRIKIHWLVIEHMLYFTLVAFATALGQIIIIIANNNILTINGFIFIEEIILIRCASCSTVFKSAVVTH